MKYYQNQDKEFERVIDKTNYFNKNKVLSGLLDSVLVAFSKTGQVEREILGYSEEAINTVLRFFPNEEIAFQIVLDAVLTIKQTANEKKHYRKYYITNKKTKILLNQAQIFQQMIWLETTKWERYQECDYLLGHLKKLGNQERIEFEDIHKINIFALEEMLDLSEIQNNPSFDRLTTILRGLHFDEKDLLQRYFKFLTQSNVSSNSTHLLITISNIIYNYSLSHVNTIATYLDPNAANGQYLYTLKSKLMNKLKIRFAGFVECQGTGVNEHFKLEIDPTQTLLNQVKIWLFLFVPWKTQCFLTKTSLRKSSYIDNKLWKYLGLIRDDDEKEITRSHILICPDCYHYLILVCNNDKFPEITPPIPVIPQFYIPREINKTQYIYNINIKNLVTNLEKSIVEEEKALEQITKHLNYLLIFVDNKKFCEWDIIENSQLEIRVNQSTELVKIVYKSENKLITIATLLLNGDKIKFTLIERLVKRKSYIVKLPENKAIIFKQYFLKDSEDICLTINYYKKWILWKNILNKLSIKNIFYIKNNRLLLANLFIIAAISCLVIGIWFYNKNLNKAINTQQNLITNSEKIENKLPKETQKIIVKESTNLIIEKEDKNNIIDKNKSLKIPVISLILNPLTRNLETSQKVTIPSKEALLSIKLRIDEFVYYKKYFVLISNIEEEKIWEARLSISRTAKNEKYINIKLPTKLLKSDDYIVTISSLPDKEEFQQQYGFTVIKQH